MKNGGGMNIRRFILYVTIILLLSGCSGSEKGIRIHNSTDEKGEKVQSLLMKDDRLTGAVVVFHDKDLIAAVSVRTFARFKKAKIEKELKEELEKSFTDKDIIVSADNKIIMETKKIIETKEKKDLGKKIEKIKTLSKEET